MKKLQPVRGTKDILEEEYRQIVLIVTYWHYLISAYGFKMIQTPIIEDSEVFRNNYNANVVTIYVSLKLLQFMPEEIYYRSIRVLADCAVNCIGDSAST